LIGQAQAWWGASRRRRRRVTWLAALLVVAGAVASLVVWVRDTGSTPSVAPTERGHGQVQFYREPKRVRLTPQAVAAARLTTYRFLRTAVLRQNVAASYALMAPSQRKGYTKERWAAGDIPVIPYPVDLRRVAYQIDYSYGPSPPDGLPRIGMEVSLHPKRGANAPAMVFGIELEAAGTGKRGHWLVAQWGPRGTLGGEPAGARGVTREEAPKGKSLSTVWLLVPAGLLAAIVIIPLGLGVRGWRRQRRVARDYRRTLELEDESVVR
jgi:hypothetical protein